MTKEQIILETVIFYGQDPVGRRSVTTSTFNDIEGCRYKGPNNTHCAFARCCTPAHLEVIVEGVLAASQIEKNGQNILQEQYRGHDSDFWRGIQRLHDRTSIWDRENKGLTVKGINCVAEFLLGDPYFNP